MAKRSAKGVPDNLRQLAKRGLRIRFSGFWLNESPRDRAIAEWLDFTQDAATVVKDIIYRHISVGDEKPPIQLQPKEERKQGSALKSLMGLED